MTSGITNSAPHAEPSSRAPKITTAIKGRMNCRIDASSTNNHDRGCSRLSGTKSGSDTTVATARDQCIAQGDRIVMLETRQLDFRVATSCGVELERRDAIAPLERALRDVGVLDANARQCNVRA